MPGRVERLFSASYRALRRRRPLFFAALAALGALCLAGFLRLAPRTDVRGMLPDRDPALRDQLALLEDAPLFRKLLVDVAGPPSPSGGADRLLAAADAFAGRLGPPEVSRVIGGAGSEAAAELPPLLARSLPFLAAPGDLAALSARTAPDQVGERLQKGLSLLLSPEGVVRKEAVLGDPLSFGEIALAKLGSLDLLPGARFARGRFLSADGRHTLLVLETPIPVTDSDGSERLMGRIDDALRALPAGYSATVAGGHPHSVANARAIKRDLLVIYGFASFAILGLVLLFLRTWQAFLVFLVPTAVILPAALAVDRLTGSLSALTVGFGAVLMDISVDYSTHTWFALRKGGGDRAATVGEIARPVLFGGITTLAGFSVLLLSSLPGQREIAVFTLTGIGLSLLLALFFLPQAASFPPAPPRPERGALPASPPRRRKAVTAAWVAALLLLGAGSLRLRFEGDLSSLSLTTPGIAAAERSLAEVWGQTGSRALLAVEGGSLEEALAANDRLFASIADRLPRGSLVSLAPLCPSLATQEANRLRWSRFWDGGRREALRAALAREGDALGFAPRAFDGFLASLASPPGAPVTLEGLRRAGLGDLVSLLVREGEGGKVTVFTLLPDTPETAALLGGPGSPLPGGVRFASASLFRATVAKALTRDFTRFLAGALLAMVLLLLLLYRDLRRPLLALVPVLTGLLFMFGAMAALGIPFNLYNVVASVLVIGLAVDYGIFMVDKLEGTADHDTDRAILLNGLTSLAGFGSLVLASHPALHSIGLSVLLGVGAAFPAALLVVPALGARGGEARG